MKKILGLDLGTNSIGWALIEIDHENGIVKILGLGSRILPMDAGEINDFESSGKIKSTAALRTQKRGQRRANERFKLRRDRLHMVLNLLDALPVHYKLEIDIERDDEKCGQFKSYKEPKIAYTINNNIKRKNEFLFKDSYKEMLRDLNIEDKKGNRIPYDWTLYYLRQKALFSKISLNELAWVLLSYNQKRGFEKTEVEEKSGKDNEIIEELDLLVRKVTEHSDSKKRKYFKVELDGSSNFNYCEFSETQMTFVNDLKEVRIISKIDETGTIISREYAVVDIYPLKIEMIKYEKRDGKHFYNLLYRNGWEQEKESKEYTFKYDNAKNKEFEYIVETIYDENGNINPIQGKLRRLREPDFSENSQDWTLLKKKTEKAALAFNVSVYGEPLKYISPQIYDILKKDAKSGGRTKIIGGMFQVIDRDFYREELNQIIKTQRQYLEKLEDRETFEKCVKTLYPKNESHARTLLTNKDALQNLLVEDILLHQRPLKSKKSEIANCKYEIRYWKNACNEKGEAIVKVDIETGELKPKKEPICLKVVSVSHPYFQEFRIWDKLHSLRLIQIEKEVNGKIKTNVDVTQEYFKNETYICLFDFINNRKTLTQSNLMQFLKPKFKENKEDYRNFVWNFPEEEELKGNETRVSFAFRFKRCGFTGYSKFLTQEKEIALWHYLDSVSYKERKENDNKSIKTFFNKFLIGNDANVSEGTMEKLINDFVNYPKFPSKYCAYSEKALKRILPFIRLGENGFKGKFDISKYELDLQNINYNKANVPSHLGITEDSYKALSKDERVSLEEKRKEIYEALWKYTINKRVDEILRKLKTIDFNTDKVDLSGVISNDKSNNSLPFPKGLFNSFKDFEKQEDFSKLDLTQASYLVYGRHSELAEAKYWISPEQIRKELHNELKQHSLNNPVAEKVILEMMQVVADIWEKYGEGKEKFFSEIHLEVGRELKKSAKEKEKITKIQKGNLIQNKRLRQVLEDFLANSKYNAIQQNNDHFERLKIVEEAAEHTKNTDKDFFKGKPYKKIEIDNILKKSKITQADFEKYKLWIEQGYKSPYTNRIIKLTDLFNGSKYNIDHVFPQASITNDSLSNKVVCEREINKLKSNQTGRGFVANPSESEVFCLAHNSNVKVVTDDLYLSIIKAQYSGTKRLILLSKEIPKGFTNSQLNNSRHIARKAMELLSHVVRDSGEVEFRSKHVLPVTGQVTSKLKKVWKLDNVWRELVAPRYQRMNELTKSSLFGDWQISRTGQKYFDCNLDFTIREKDESYDIKRIDHRHHALDALIVALCTELHVNYINNINANAKSDDFGKQKQIERYRETLKKKIKFSKPNQEEPIGKDWFYMLPGEKRQGDATNSAIDTVLRKVYYYKDDFFTNDYRKMILTALQKTIVTFKHNNRVINKTVNKYKKGPDSFEKQNIENGQKLNWSIRRSLGKETFYGTVDLGETVDKELYGALNEVFKNPDLIIDEGLRFRIIEIKDESKDSHKFEKQVKSEFSNRKIRLKVFKIASREPLSDKFNRKKIEQITDTGIQKILLNHLRQFDTVELPFEEAIQYPDSSIEYRELESIVNDAETKFQSIEELELFLKANDFRYKKTDYSKLNIFIEKVTSKDFRNDPLYLKKINEHPEIAFTPGEIERMNTLESIRKFNVNKNGEEKSHTPIRKVRIARGYGNQRPLSENQESVKSKQYVVNDAGSNLYLGFYKGTRLDKDGNLITERKYKDIGLIDLIESLKQDKDRRLNPLQNKFYDEEQNEFNLIFTLSPLDIVFVPTSEEIENPSLFCMDNLSSEQISRIYKYVDGGGGIANFVPYYVAQPIWKFHDNKKKKEVYQQLIENGKLEISEDELIKDEFGFGSQQTKNQNMIDGVSQVKKICWKLQVDRLGNILVYKYD